MAGLRALLTDPTWRTTDKYTRTYLGYALYRCGVSWARHRALRPPPAGQLLAGEPAVHRGQDVAWRRPVHQHDRVAGQVVGGAVGQEGGEVSGHW